MCKAPPGDLTQDLPRRVLRAPALWESLQVLWNLQRERGEITWTFFQKNKTIK